MAGVTDDLSAPLSRLAAAYGVATEFWDWRGQHTRVPSMTVIAVLAALGVAAGTEAEARAALQAWEDGPWRLMVPPCVVTRAGTARQVYVHVPHGASVQVSVQPEDGSPRRQLPQVDRYVHPRPVDGALVGEATFEMPADCPWAGTSCRPRAARPRRVARVVVTPSFLGLPASMPGRSGVGLHDPAVLRAVKGVVGPRRPCRPA